MRQLQPYLFSIFRPVKHTFRSFTISANPVNSHKVLLLFLCKFRIIQVILNCFDNTDRDHDHWCRGMCIYYAVFAYLLVIAAIVSLVAWSTTIWIATTKKIVFNYTTNLSSTIHSHSNLIFFIAWTMLQVLKLILSMSWLTKLLQPSCLDEVWA